ncbi:MAG: hypothetical protein QOH32_4652 [Bradyrhizobium sp.]|jgi:type II secretory pathway pseudopilin PulG|nr:hypothetical protein [Bradyrhizobium sp.]
MTRPPKSLVASCPDSEAFTLAELLVSISILALLIVLVARLTMSATATITATGKHMDSDRTARVVLEKLALDMARMIKRDDIAYSFNKVPGNDSIAFFCQTPGFYELASDPTTKESSYDASAGPPSYSRRRANASLVAYVAAPNTADASNIDLRRLSRGLVWADDYADTAPYNCVVFLPIQIVGTPGVFASASKLYDAANKEFKLLSEQVFRFEYCFLLKDGTLSVNPWIAASPYSHSSTTISDIAAIVFTVAILDNTSRTVAGDMRNLAASLPDAVDGKNIAAAWLNVVNGKDAANPFPPPNSPRIAASAVRVYQRYCYLETK